MFEKFVKLNDWYEKQYIDKQFIKGQNLWEEYKKQEDGYHSPYDDSYYTCILKVKASL